ncbi:MAG: low molecular weight phosphotyrosine protein phosphatase [Treponema sp.]|nr:low molecular weight phosphotyrosine protein phosphatase [Treponema sp.]
MVRILFVCHGNICRSAMAEFVMKNLVKKAGREKDFFIESAATSTEELGNDMYPPAKAKLREVGVPFSRHYARQITKSDYNNYDLLIGMDSENLFYMNRCWNNDPENKIRLLLEFAGSDREVADPWYTGNFDRTYDDVLDGCTGLLELYK